MRRIGGLVTAKKRTKAASKKGARGEVRRRRRAPEEARAHLLDAAERLLSERGPDAVGLRDVAREAGVSHGLITHYFGTYEGLVEAVFARRTAGLADRVVARPAESQAAPSASELMDTLLSVVSEPVHLRLVAWAMLSGRARQADFLPGRHHGMRPIADAIHDAACAEAKAHGGRPPSRDDVDYAVLLAVGAAYGWGLGKQPFLAALGRSSSASTDREVMSRLATMVRALLSPTRD